MSDNRKWRRWAFVSVIVTLILIGTGCFFYWERQGDHGWGPFTGVVLDAETKKPIKGARVSFHVTIENTIQVITGTGASFHTVYTETDSKGRYRIRKYVHWKSVNNARWKFRVYKTGFLCYGNSTIYNPTKDKLVQDFRSFKGKKGLEFKVKNNIVLLEKQDNSKFTGKDHSAHVQFIGCAHCCNSEEGKKFCREAREEMILGCMGYTRTRELCEEIVDDKLGITNESENKR